MKTAIALLALSAVALVACWDDPDSADGVVAAFTEAGLRATPLAEAKPVADGVRCREGAVDGVAITVCELPDADAAAAAQPAGLARVGDATGTSLASGPMLLVVADRDGVDPSGRTINRIAQAFLDRQPSLPPAGL